MLGNVNNTSDANKPVSSATQTALNAKANLVGGKVPESELPNLVDDITRVQTSRIYENLTELSILHGSQNSFKKFFLVAGSGGTNINSLDVYSLPPNALPNNTANYVLEKTIGVFGYYNQELILDLQTQKLFTISGSPWGTASPFGLLPTNSIEANNFFAPIVNYENRPFDNTHYRIASDGNGFNANDNTKFLYAKNRLMVINGVIYKGSIFHFINNFFQFEDFIITRNGTFDLPLNRDNTTWSAINTSIFSPSGSSNWETSEGGNHRITIIILDPDVNTANSNRIVIFEKVA